MSMYIVHMCYVCFYHEFCFANSPTNLFSTIKCTISYNTIYIYNILRSHNTINSVLLFSFILLYLKLEKKVKKYSIAVFDYPNFNIKNFQLFQSNIVRYSFALIFIDRYLFNFFFFIYSIRLSVFILNKR